MLRNRLFALWLFAASGCPSVALGAPPAPAPRDTSAPVALRLAQARAAFEAEMTALAVSPSRSQLEQVHRAMREIQSGADAYFHGAVPTTADTRAAMVALRAEVMRLLGGAVPVLLVSEDVLRFQPEVHRRLATWAAQLGEFRHAIDHLRSAQAVDGGRREDLEALLAAHRAMGDAPGADAVSAEMRALSEPGATASGRP
jgi:Flp pilus assembly protein TadD